MFTSLLEFCVFVGVGAFLGFHSRAFLDRQISNPGLRVTAIAAGVFLLPLFYYVVLVVIALAGDLDLFSSQASLQRHRLVISGFWIEFTLRGCSFLATQFGFIARHEDGEKKAGQGQFDSLEPAQDETLGLDEIYDLGSGVPRDDGDSARFYLARALRGDVLAQYNMGVICLQGWGVRQNKAEAARWFLVADEQGGDETDAADALAILQTHNVRPHGFPKVFSQRFEFFNQNFGAAQATLDWVYDLSGTPESPKGQVQHYIALAEQGDAEAAYNAGVMIANGDGARKNAARAIEFFEKSALAGNRDAQYVLGCSLVANEKSADNIRGYAWLEIAARARHSGARAELPYVRPLLTRSGLAKAEKLIERDSAGP